MNSNDTILFVPHSPLQFEMAHHWAKTGKELGYSTLCLLLYNKLDVFLNDNYSTCFDNVVDLEDVLIKGEDIPFDEKVRTLKGFENNYEACSFNVDWSIDRAIQFAEISYEQAIALTFQYVKALEKIIEKYDVQIAVSEKLFLPQRITHYILTEKGGHHLFPIKDRFFDRFYFEEGLDWTWKDARRKYEEIDISSADIPSEVLNKYQNIVFKNDKGILDKHEKELGIGKVKIENKNNVFHKIFHNREPINLYDEFLNKNKLEPLFQSLKRKIKEYLNIRSYLKEVDNIMPEGDYILYLFHFQPEYTVDALAPDYANQVDFLVRVAKNLPSDVQLIVKENPLSVGKENQTPEYYDGIYKTPNIKMVHHSIDSHQLVKGAKAVITLTGTVGLESMFFGVPVIVFGNIFYSSFRYVQEAEDFEDGIRKIHEVLGGKIELTYEESVLRNHSLQVLLAMYESSYPGKMFNAFHPEHHREEKNIELLKEGFKKELLSFKDIN